MPKQAIFSRKKTIFAPMIEYRPPARAPAPAPATRLPLPLGAAALEAAAGDPHAKSIGVVIAANSRRTGVVLDDWQPTHFATPVNDG